MSRLTFTLAALLLFPFAMFSQKHIERGYRTILSSDARFFVETLASDSLQGRDAGEEGGRMAAEYIVSLLDEWGIKPLGKDDYLQSFTVDGCAMNNILAVVPGKSDEYVVVGTHYDHVGFGAAVDGDSCYNGADDNASGVSAVLQIARAVKKMRKNPERGIIFAFWDGEEKGLLGSRHFV
jgi:acetylornithine deacetylase/succinyl-diaminopimelate desuccinylase-like protein